MLLRDPEGWWDWLMYAVLAERQAVNFVRVTPEEARRVLGQQSIRDVVLAVQRTSLLAMVDKIDAEKRGEEPVLLPLRRLLRRVGDEAKAEELAEKKKYGL